MQIDVNGIVLAALLHDIGKVMQRAGLEKSNYPEHCRMDKNTKVKSHLHVDWTYSFMRELILSIGEDEWLLLCETAASHHAPETFGNGVSFSEYKWLADCIIAADRLASAWDREAGEEGSNSSQYKKIPLYSVFADIDLGLKTVKPQEEGWTLPIQRLSPQSCVPSKADAITDKTKEYLSLWKEFYQAAIRLKTGFNSGKLDLGQFVDALDNLLQEFMWSVPANTMEKQPCNSLYFHLKNTAAIAAAIWLAYKDKPEKIGKQLHESSEQDFALIGFDLSGIQDYLYDLSKENTGKSAKFLRARSFHIRSVLEMALHWLIAELGISRQNILFTAAGKAFILLPDKAEFKTKYDKFRLNLEQEMLSRFQGNLALVTAYLPIGLQELGKRHFKQTMSALLEKLEAEKQVRFKLVLHQDNWQTDRFILKEDAAIYSDQTCSYCQRRKSDGTDEEGNNICKYCKSDETLGKRLAGGNVFKYMLNSKEKGLLHLGPVTLKEAEEKEIGALDKEKYYFSLKTRVSEAIGFYPFAGKTPLIEGNIASFDQIAQTATGVKAIAVLKGDVDNLGLILQKGIGKTVEQGKELSITTYATFSAQIDYYFSVYLPHLAGKEKYKDSIYIIYAGGDDFCLAGAWDKTIDFAAELRKDFARYTCRNPLLHFSAAVEMIHIKSPVRFAINEADRLLDEAKKPLSPKTQDTAELLAKDKFSVFHMPVNWKRFDIAMAFAEKLQNWLDDPRENGITLQFIYRLLAYHDMYMKTREPDCDVRNYLYDALLNYDIKRNISQLKNNIIMNEQTVSELTNLSQIGSDNLLDILRIPLCYVLYKNRKKQGD